MWECPWCERPSGPAITIEVVRTVNAACLTCRVATIATRALRPVQRGGTGARCGSPGARA
jgi:hypothetical protein